MKSPERLFQRLARGAGVEMNGPNPWDPRIHSGEVYSRVLRQGSLGLGEAYMEGLWDCEALDEFCTRILEARLGQASIRNPVLLLRLGLAALAHKLFNPQKGGETKVGERHYDTGNDFFSVMLGPTLAYSCGYWKEASTLEEAQRAKHDLICRKLQLRPGMRLLDVGCGWGSFLRYAAEQYGVRGVGITISREQAEFGQAACGELPVETRIQSYRELAGEQFERIVSVGMFEHVGHKNYPLFMRAMQESLAEDGLFLLHTIGSRETVRTPDAWFAKYIFPNSEIPSRKLLEKEARKRFAVLDWHEFGEYYDPTLMAWYANLERGKDSLAPRYREERFWRMWRYFLLMCAGVFRSRSKEVWQLVLSKHPFQGAYPPVR